MEDLPCRLEHWWPAIAVSALLVVAPLDALAAEWSAPRDLTRSFAQVSRPDVMYWSDGAALVTWRALPRGASWRAALEDSNWRTHLGVIGRGGRFRERAEVRAELAIPIAYGRDHVATLRQSIRSPRRRDAALAKRRLAVSFGSAHSPLGVTRTVATYVPVFNVAEKATSSIASGINGDVAIAWGERVGTAGESRSQRYRVALGSARRGFGRPVTLAVGGGGPGTGTHTVELAFSGDGDLVAVYATRRGLEARVRPRGARRFSRPTVLGDRDDYVAIATGKSVDGRVAVAWLTRDYGEGIENRYSVRVATQRRRARFTRGQLLDRGPRTFGGPAHVGIAAGDDGRLTVAWPGLTADTSPRTVRASTGTAGGNFAPYTEMAPSGGFFADVVSGAGTTLLVWREWRGPKLPGPGAAGPGYVVHAAIQPCGAPALHGPQAITGIEAWSTAWAPDDPAAAINPRTREVSVIWAAARSTSGPPPSRVPDSAVVRFARRTPLGDHR